MSGTHTNLDIQDARQKILYAFRANGVIPPQSFPLQYLQDCTDSFSRGRLIENRNGVMLYKATDAVLNIHFILKLINRAYEESIIQSTTHMFRCEVEVWRRFPSPKMAPVYGYATDPRDPNAFVAVMSKAIDDFPSLKEFIDPNRNPGHIEFRVKMRVGFDIAKALCHLHTSQPHHVGIHRGVNLSSVLIQQQHGTVPTAILVNFGRSIVYSRRTQEGIYGMADDVYDFGQLLMDLIALERSQSARRSLGWDEAPAREIWWMAREATRPHHQDRIPISHMLQHFHKIEFAFCDDVKDLEHGVKDVVRTCVRCGELRTLGIYCRRHYDPHFLCRRCFQVRLDHDMSERNFQLTCPVEGCNCPPFGYDDVLYMRDPAMLSLLLRSEFNATATPSTPTRHEEITVLFSSPLAFVDEETGKVCPSPQLDCAREKQLLRDIPGNIPFWFDTATIQCLSTAVSRNSCCLHYTGHCNGTYLLFEDGEGGTRLVEPEELNEYMIPETSSDNTPCFDVIFLAACESEDVGKAFAKAGVSHVICCRRGASLSDRAAPDFARAFYQNLMDGKTVKDSFEAGKRAVFESNFAADPREEMEKYLLLPTNVNHDVPIFMGRASAQTQQQQQHSVGDGPRLIPYPPEYFVGRELDMFWLLKEIMSRRLVTLFGSVEGIGTSTVSTCVSSYIDERKSSMECIDEVIYIQQSQSQESLLRSLHSRLVTDTRAGVVPLDASDKELTRSIMDALGDSRTWIVFDAYKLRMHSSDWTSLKQFLTPLFQRTQKIRVMIVSGERLDLNFGFVREQPFELQPLDVDSTIRLFVRQCSQFRHKDEVRKKIRLAIQQSETVCMQLYRKFGDGIPERVLRIASAFTNNDCEKLNCIIQSMVTYDS